MNRTVERFAGRFSATERQEIRYETELSAADVADLLGMTPNFWHLDEEVRARAARGGPAAVTVAVTIVGFRPGARG